MLICVKSDAEYHPSAHLHVIYNPADLKLSLWNPYRIDHWPMPRLIPRDTNRGNLVENISYIGTQGQLSPELKSPEWQQSLEALNVHWQPVFEKNQWHNYRHVDVLIAARDFQGKSYNNKGPIKLINAWLAGVPAILTPESGFLAQRKSDLDFLIIRSLEDAISSIDLLKNSPEIYAAMVKNGLERSQEFSINKILGQWQSFFQNFAFPHYQKWCQMSRLEKSWLYRKRFVYFKIDRVQDKMQRLSQKLRKF
jgi:hypothetical protein